MRRGGTGLLLLAAALTGSGCANPTQGTAAAVPLADRPLFGVELLPRVQARQPQWRPVGHGGGLDPYAGGSTVIVEGWAPSHSSRLVLVTDVRVKVLNNRRLVRHDPGRVHDPADDYDLGFRLVLRPLTGRLGRVCLLSTGPKHGYLLLPGSDLTLCQPPP